MAHEADPYASSNEGSKYSESNFTLDSTQDDPRFVRDRHFRVGCELLRACGTNDEGKVARILEAEPRMSTFKDYDGRTALHVAASLFHFCLWVSFFFPGAPPSRNKSAPSN